MLGVTKYNWYTTFLGVVELGFLVAETTFESTRIDKSPSLIFSPVKPPPELDSPFESTVMPSLDEVKRSLSPGIIWKDPEDDAEGGREAGSVPAGRTADEAASRFNKIELRALESSDKEAFLVMTEDGIESKQNFN